MSRRPVDLPALVEGVGSGRKRAVARAITLVENRDPLAYELVRTDRWPTPVLRVGKLIKIPTAPLLSLLEASPLDRRDRPRAE